MNLQLKKQEKGFTIIEVLIVLAIAGLIMLIVFLAVPALQRNSRNTQRSDDASKIAAAINDCLANRNGRITSCDTTAELNGLDTSKLSILTTLNAPTTNGTTMTALAANNDNISWAFKNQCNQDGSNNEAANTDRSGAIVYNAEAPNGGSTKKCLGI